MPEPDDLITVDPDGTKVIFFCPACQTLHCVPLGSGGMSWQLHRSLKASLKNPTILGPSIVIRTPTPENPYYICHFWLQGGLIRYVGCTHPLDGLSIKMIPFRDWFKVTTQQAKQMSD